MQAGACGTVMATQWGALFLYSIVEGVEADPVETYPTLSYPTLEADPLAC